MNLQRTFAANTGGRIGYEDPSKARVARIQSFHDARHPSVLHIPMAASHSATH